MTSPIIVGAGISGLAAAAWLPNAIVLEAKECAGGWIQTQENPLGFSIDLAANGWLDNEPTVTDLLHHVGLEDEILPASSERTLRYVYHHNTLISLPQKPPHILTSPLLSLWSKIRLLCEPFIAKYTGEKEESVAEFVSRRLGKGVLSTLLSPMTAGVFAAQPEELSLKASFPRLFEMEQQYGSLLRAILKSPKTKEPVLTSLKTSTGALCTHIAQQLGSRLHTQCPVTQIDRKNDKWILNTPEGLLETNQLILACPAFVQAKLLASISPTLAEKLAEIRYSSVALVVSVYRKEEYNPQGFGMLVSRDTELHNVLGILFSSRIFPSRYPKEYTITRTILGGTRYPHLLKLPDHEILLHVHKAHNEILRTTAKPIGQHVFRHARSIPLYDVHHATRQNDIQSLLKEQPGLQLIGNHLGGVGVKDCIRNGHDAAKRILASASD